MARAFATLANGGKRVDGERARQPAARRSARRARPPGGLERPGRRSRSSNANDAAIVNSILQDVVNEGTGERAALDDRPVAGKTGTTENYGDAWFVGYTPQLAVAVWVGYPNRLKPMETEFNGDPVAGGTFPSLIWKTFAKTALDHLEEPPAYFDSPVYDEVAPLNVVYRNSKWFLDNGNCRDASRSSTSSAPGPTSRRRCKPNEVDVPHVVGSSARRRRGTAALHAADAGNHLAPGRARASGLES